MIFPECEKALDIEIYRVDERVACIIAELLN